MAGPRRSAGDGRGTFGRSATGSSIRSPGLLDSVPRRPVTRGESPSAVREALGLTGPLPERARIPRRCSSDTARLLFDHSLFNAHPRFFGYITAPPAPIGILGDLLAAARQPERRRLDAVAGGDRDRIADRAVDRRADRLSRRVRRPARQRRQHGQLRLLLRRARRAGRAGTCASRASRPAGRALRVYASAETHTWMQKAADLSGLGTDAIRWIPIDADLRMDVAALRAQHRRRTWRRRRAVHRRRHGRLGEHRRRRSAPAIAAVCREHGIWFHVDGAYGGLAAAMPGRARRSARRSRGGLGGGRSAQVAVRAARGGLRAGARSGGAARRVLVPPAVLPLRGAARRTTSTTGRRTRAASARSRCGSRCGRRARRATGG